MAGDSSSSSGSGSTSELRRRAVAYDALPVLSGPLVSPMGARVYKAQFAPLYDFRLRVLRKRVREVARAKWEAGASSSSVYSKGKAKAKAEAGGDADEEMDIDQEQPSSTALDAASSSLLASAHARFVPRILDVQPGEVCYVIGTVYCSMPLKPDVLEDLTREQWLPPQPVRAKYVDAERDEIYLEDESGRVRLAGPALSPPGGSGTGGLRAQMVTGVVVGVLGTETKGGDFEIADIVFPEGPEPAKLSARSPEAENAAKAAAADDKMGAGAGAGSDDAEDQWVALVSGLEVGADEHLGSSDEAGGAPGLRASSELRLLLLSEWLAGLVGDDEDREQSTRIAALVLAGNSLAQPVRSEEEKRGTRKALAASKQLTTAPSPPKILDAYLSDLAATMRVHLMPGHQDPAPVVLPQQPIHHALLPKASRWSGLKRETNPAWFGLGGKKLLGTSGQNIDDIFKYMDEGHDSRIQMALQTLQWGHIAPTAPDTLWCIPFTDRDPFLLAERPDIYFVGNQPAFATGLYLPSHASSPAEAARPTRVVMLPRFCETGEVALVNLRTLECRLERIAVDL